MKVIIFACALSIAYANAIDKPESEAHMHEDSEPAPADDVKSVRQGKQYAFAYAQPNIHPIYAPFIPSYQPQYYAAPQAYRFAANDQYAQIPLVQHPQYLQSSRNLEAASTLASTPEIPSIKRIPDVTENNAADSQGRFLWNYGSSTNTGRLCKYNVFGGGYICYGG